MKTHFRTMKTSVEVLENADILSGFVLSVLNSPAINLNNSTRLRYPNILIMKENTAYINPYFILGIMRMVRMVYEILAIITFIKAI